MAEVLSLSPAIESTEERLQFIELMTARCDEVQQRVLAEILEQNGDAEYLRRHGIAGDTDRATFKAKIPVVNYEDLLPDIQRIANGDNSAILTGQPISEFLTSSGTSAGARKLIPCIKEDHGRRHLLYSLISAVLEKNAPGLKKGKGLYFLFVKSESKTPGGLLARTVLTSFFNSQYFDSFRQNYTSPRSAILNFDTNQSMHIQMLCALYLRHHVLHVGAIFASGLLRAIHYLQTHWTLLARDIASGTLSPSITDPSLHDSVVDILRPDPLLSQFITEQCSNPDWAGIITRIWPNTKFLHVIITGTMAQYIPALQFYSGGLPIASCLFGSSESYFGLNLNPTCLPSEVAYTIMPNMAYFEFAPLNEDDNSLVDLADVELGKEYELVVTTYSGLYRYRVGDVVSVSGFYNSAPQFKFIRRKNVLLSIESDKTDEVELHRAVERATKVLTTIGMSVAEYTSHACTKSIPGHYVIYWELLWQGKLVSTEEMVNKVVMERCCLAMEEEFNSVYRQSRVMDKSIGPLEIRIVRDGTFGELMNHAISRGASIDQYKVPRCVNDKSIIEILDSRILSTYFSQEFPKWSPN